MAMFSSKDTKGTMMIPVPKSDAICPKDTVVFPSVNPKGGACTFGNPGGISPIS